MASKKVILVVALLFLLKCHWAQCQFFGPYNGGFGFPGCYGGYDDDDDWEMILPILLLTMCGRGDYGGYGGYGPPVPIPYANGGCGCCCGCCSGCCGCGRC
ncbi:unnamed protein product, partial [Brenthis ino]